MIVQIVGWAAITSQQTLDTAKPATIAVRVGRRLVRRLTISWSAIIPHAPADWMISNGASFEI